MPYLTLQTIHLSRLLLHIVLNEVKMIEQSVATEKYPNMIPELQRLDLFLNMHGKLICD